MSDPEPTHYALRVHERALRDIDAARLRFTELVSEAVADEWLDGLRTAIADLAGNPRRYARVPERFRREVRHLVYRRLGSRVAYRVLFTITGEQEGSPEAPTVTILHVRHGAARPITRAEAREIEADQQ